MPDLLEFGEMIREGERRRMQRWAIRAAAVVIAIFAIILR